MAIKLFNRKPKFQEIILDSDVVFTKLDKLMGEMASIDTYIEYLELREGMQELGSRAPRSTFVKSLRSDLYHPGITGMDLILSDLSGIVIL